MHSGTHVIHIHTHTVPDKNENHFEDVVTVSQKLLKKGRQGGIHLHTSTQEAKTKGS